MHNTIYEHAPKRGWVPRNVDTVLCQKVLGTIIKPKKITLSITDINLVSTFKPNH